MAQPYLRREVRVSAYINARRLKMLKVLVPDEAIGKAWTKERARFSLVPFHRMLRYRTALWTRSQHRLVTPAPCIHDAWDRIVV